MRLLVLGGGPAGLNAALQGRELGAQVILIGSDRLGGTSLNCGPAPVRALARAARLVRDTQACPAFGLRGPGPEVDLAATLENAGRVADYAHHEQRLSGCVAATGIELVEGVGPARFLDPTPTFTEALGMAAQQLVRELRVARLPPSPSDLAPASLQGGNHREK
jgi:pyruvate/2-oxoglutarate dehydrogenase complex dihydrolipoamide dehydrogenase (E3) component